jgi:hypothetical protein
MLERFFLIPVVATSLLSGCGGSSTGGGGGSTGGGGTSYEQLATTGANFIAQYGDSSLTAPASMPTGTATYRGVAALSTDYSEPEDIIQNAGTLSELELIANFGTSALNGRLYNFQEDDPEYSLSGELQVSGTIVSNGFTATINGTLTESFLGDTSSVDVTGDMAGVFVGSSANALLGLGTVTACSALDGCANVFAGFVAEQQ